MSLQQLQALPSFKRQELFGLLRKIYQELDKKLALIPQPCTACGACCHFSKSEHRLYVSSLEMAMLLEQHPWPKSAQLEDRCPYQKDGKCSVRLERMIGCRTFFRLHEPQDRNQAEDFYAEALAKIKNIYKSGGISWEYRDLMSAPAGSRDAHNE